MSARIDINPFLETLRKKRREAISALITSTDVSAEQIIGDAQQITPVDKGVLQGSGTTTPAEYSDGKISKELGFNTDYAAAVHENLEAKHRVGEAKYLEKAMSADAPKVLAYIGKKFGEAISG